MSSDAMLKQKIWAVVGANQNPTKFGNRIYRKLKEYNYRVYAVNTKYTEVDGDPCYPSLADLPEKPDVINMVVEPEICQEYLQKASDLGIRNVWLQPGTYNRTTLDLAGQLGLETALNCVLVAITQPFSD